MPASPSEALPPSERLLGFMRADDAGARISKVDSFRTVLLLVLAVQQVHTERLPFAAILLGLAVLAWTTRYGRQAVWAALAIELPLMASTYPWVANHSYFEALLLALLSLVDADDEGECDLFLQTARWLIVFLFLHAGVQKIWYGQYFDGRFLAWLASSAERTHLALGLVIPAEEMARLAALPREAGSGPYLVGTPLFLLASNAAWVSEIVAAALLTLPKTRLLGIVFGVGMMCGIEFLARELVFGILVVAMLLLFWPSDLNRRLLPAYAVLFAYLAAARLGWLPGPFWA